MFESVSDWTEGSVMAPPREYVKPECELSSVQIVQTLMTRKRLI